MWKKIYGNAFLTHYQFEGKLNYCTVNIGI